MSQCPKKREEENKNCKTGQSMLTGPLLIQQLLSICSMEGKDPSSTSKLQLYKVKIHKKKI